MGVTDRRSGDDLFMVGNSPSCGTPPRCCLMEERTLKDIRQGVLGHVETTYLKQVPAPTKFPSPS